MKTILVVDDDTDIRETVAMALTDEGYCVRQAVNGQDALVTLGTMHPPTPCLVLLDMAMPVMTGAEMMVALIASGRLPELPIVVFSAQPEDAHGLGARRLVRKPIALKMLLSVVHDVCGLPDDASPHGPS